MTKRVPLVVSIILIILAVLITFQITYVSLNNKYSSKLNDIMISQNLYSKLSEIENYYENFYIGELDEDKITDNVMRGYIYGTGDKHGTYLNAEQRKEYMADIDGTGVGIGVMVTYDVDRSALEIITVMPDSPSLAAGLEVGDYITAVEGVTVYDSGYYGAVGSVKGEEGTNVKLTVFRMVDGEYVEIDFEITRANISYISVMSHMYEDGITGIVRILSFDLNTPEQFIAAVEELMDQGAERFVFDVRNNSGGELRSIHAILDYLVPEGPTIRIIDKEGNEELMNSDAEYLDVPMVVLINSRTASAAELFAAALRDYEKADLVGITSYGKGTMQTVVPLADDSALVISYRMYAPPFSENYDGVGLIPDLEIELSEEAAKQNVYKIADADDNQLLAAINSLS
jgi:C-terminal peptidase (prc)